jgi:hypothetical protein
LSDQIATTEARQEGFYWVVLGLFGHDYAGRVVLFLRIE